MREMTHCCCCVPLPDGVMLVGVYGTAFHTGLLVIQMTHGASLAPEPHLLHPPFAADIVRRLLLAAHLLGILVNLLLLCGMYWGHRRLMLPWLFLQGFLASILAALACYYLVLFPLKNSCISEETLVKKNDANFRPLSFISSTNFEEEGDDDGDYNAFSSSSSYKHASYFSCKPLLWYGAIMILSLLILFYYFYIVNDFLDQLKADKKRKKALWKIDIALRDPSEEPEEQDIQQQEQHQQNQSLENVVVLDDTVPATSSGSGNDSSNIKQVTFNTSSTVQGISYTTSTVPDSSTSRFYTTSTVQDSSSSSPEAVVPPKKTSRVAWQEHVEVME